MRDAEQVGALQRDADILDGRGLSHARRAAAFERIAVRGGRGAIVDALLRHTAQADVEGLALLTGAGGLRLHALAEPRGALVGGRLTRGEQNKEKESLHRPRVMG